MHDVLPVSVVASFTIFLRITILFGIPPCPLPSPPPPASTPSPPSGSAACSNGSQSRVRASLTSSVAPLAFLPPSSPSSSERRRSTALPAVQRGLSCPVQCSGCSEWRRERWWMGEEQEGR